MGADKAWFNGKGRRKSAGADEHNVVSVGLKRSFSMQERDWGQETRRRAQKNPPGLRSRGGFEVVLWKQALI